MEVVYLKGLKPSIDNAWSEPEQGFSGVVFTRTGSSSVPRIWLLVDLQHVLCNRTGGTVMIGFL